MSISRNYHSILLITIALFALPVDARQQPECDAAVTVNHHGDEVLDEDALQKHIDGISEQMATVRLRQTRGPQLNRTLELRRHLAQMREAMQELHDQMYLMGCRVKKQEVSLDARVEAMEMQMKFLRQMLEQVIEHLSENESEPTP